MGRDRLRRRRQWHVMWLLLFLVIVTAIPILLVGFFMIADAIVATAATDDGPVIPQVVVSDHAGCLSSDPFIPPPTLLECYLHTLNLALHADVFKDGHYREPCGPAYDHIKKKILLPKIRPLLLCLPLDQ
jgi:hypothetical protein